MKFPRLRDMPVNALICLASQKNDEKFTKYVEQIVMEKLLEERKSVVDLVIDFSTSKGLRRKKLGEIIALRMTDVMHLVDIKFIDVLLDELEVDYLWMLSTNAIIPLVRKMAKERLMAILDEYDKELNELYVEKVTADELVLNLKRGDYNDGN